MPNNVLYYRKLEELTLLVGNYVCKKALIRDLKRGFYTSPDSINLLSKYYGGDIYNLRACYEKERGEINKVFEVVLDILKAEGRFNHTDAKTFVSLMQKTEDTCDFRTKVRDWSRNELKREDKKPGSSRFYDLGDLLGRYDDLLMDRRNRGK